MSVVMVTYNSRELLQHSLSPLTSVSAIEIIVVDNASQDGTAQHVAEAYPSVNLIRSDVNNGFAKAVNAGARIANGEVILLLNPDAIVDVKNILILRDTLLRRPDIGVIAPLLEHPGLNLAVREAGMKPSLWRVFCHYFGLSRISPDNHGLRGLYILRRENFQTTPVEWVSGACMAVPRSVWTAQGGLTERWFMYAEDVEFCLRVHRSGLAVVLSADAVGVHGLGKSSGSVQKLPSTDWMTNLYELYKSDISHSAVQNFVWKYVFFAGMLTRAYSFGAKAVFRRKRPTADPGYIKFLFFAREILKEDWR
ncbi:hypothetical protein CH293_07050 [Rhodococcus sp. 14-2470-1b]|nr:hypothetical protein CH293_07050 [Rhodococcus sp. 14-2470-1b]